MHPWESWMAVTATDGFYGTLVVSFLAMTALTVFIFRKLWRDSSSGLRRFAMNGVLVVMSLLLLFVAIEGSVRYMFLPGATLGVAGRIWGARYLQPINAAGFRGPAFDARADAAHTVMVVGDSFAAGMSIRRFEDAFPGQLQQALGGNWSVVTVAQPGWDIDQYLEGLGAHLDLAPDVVLCSLFVNDIQSVAGEYVYEQLGDVGTPGGVTGFLVHTFASASVAYSGWVVPRVMAHYYDVITDCYTEAAIVSRYEERLLAFARLVAEADATLVVLMWPLFADVPPDAETYAVPRAIFARAGVPVIDLPRVLEGIPLTSLAVSASDIHPNEAACERVAGIVSDALKAEVNSQGAGDAAARP